MIAPDRIWAVTDPDDISAQIMGAVYAQQVPDGMVGCPVKYIRADLCDPMQDKRVKALVEAVKAMPQDWYDDNCDCKPCEALHAALRALEQGKR